MKALLRYLLALARELSDESGYGRYLHRNGLAPSGAAWRAFIDQRHRRKYQHAKCC